jgi:acyl carrier protein
MKLNQSQSLQSIFNNLDLSVNIDKTNWNEDLLQSSLIDSFDLLNLIFEIEARTNTKIDASLLGNKFTIKHLISLLNVS